MVFYLVFYFGCTLVQNFVPRGLFCWYFDFILYLLYKDIETPLYAKVLYCTLAVYMKAQTDCVQIWPRHFKYNSLVSQGLQITSQGSLKFWNLKTTWGKIQLNWQKIIIVLILYIEQIGLIV